MAGFANDVVFANNGDFSIAGSNKGQLANGLLTNGQMWIGRTAVNAGGTHISVGSIVSPDGSMTVDYATPNITVENSLGKGRFPITPYVVGLAGQAGYQTIQEVINLLKPGFGPHTIFLQGGFLYAESLDFTGFTFDCNIILRATSLFAQSSVDGVTIIGKITPPDSGQIFFENINLEATTGDVFSSSSAGTARIWLRNCNCETVSGGFLFGLPNWTGDLVLENFRASGIITDNGIINNTGGSSLQITDSVYVGTLTGTTSVISGPTLIQNSILYNSLNFVTGSSATLLNSTFNKNVTFSNNSTATIEQCNFSTGSSPAITMSSSGAVNLFQSTITSSNVPAITGSGAGTLTYGDINFTSNSAFAGTLTLATAAWRPYSQAIASTDGTKVGTAAFDSTFFTVDTSGFVSLVGGGAFTWTDQSGSFNAVKEHGYFITNTSTATLPASPTQGDTIIFSVDTTNVLTITGNTGQVIRIGSAVTAAAGTAVSTARGNSVTLVYRSSDTAWIADSVIGTWTIT